jgi:raffinose/stachyose/melibiose transport system permease protein
MKNAGSKASRKKSEFYRQLTFGLMVIPGSALYIAFFIAPILWGIYYSFTNYNGIARSYRFIGLRNFTDSFNNPRFLGAFSFTLRYAVTVSVLVVTISLIIALLLNRKLRLRGLFRSVFFLPAILSGLTVGLIFNELYARALPSLGQLLDIGFLSGNVLSRSNTAFWGVAFVHVWGGLAIPTVLFLAGLQVIPGELLEAAEIDGAGKWQRFKYITVPFILPIFSVVMVLVIKGGLTVFDIIMATTTGGPAGSTESLALLVYNHGYAERKFSMAIAESLMMAVMICAVSFIQISWSNRHKVYK